MSCKLLQLRSPHALGSMNLKFFSFIFTFLRLVNITRRTKKEKESQHTQHAIVE